MQQTIANVDVTIWNDAQELANNALSAVGQSTLVSQKSEYSKHFRENLN